MWRKCNRSSYVTYRYLSVHLGFGVTVVHQTFKCHIFQNGNDYSIHIDAALRGGRDGVVECHRFANNVFYERY